jgi:hypothetical protein
LRFRSRVIRSPAAGQSVPLERRGAAPGAKMFAGEPLKPLVCVLQRQGRAVVIGLAFLAMT